MEYSALDIINHFNNLKGRRAVLNKQLEDAAMYAAPAKYGTMFDSKEGSSKQEGAKERPVYIVSDFAQEAANTFTRGLFSNLFPPSVRWFSYAVGQTGDQNVPETVKEFFSRASQRVYEVLYATNWTTEMSEVCEDAPVTGTMTLSVEFDPARLLLFKSHYISRIYCTKSADAEIDTVYEELNLTATQALNIFSLPGDKLSKKLTEDANSKETARSEKIYRIIHFVAPNRDRKFRTVERDGAIFSEPVPGPAGRRFLSYYVEIEEKSLIRQGGYDHNPYTVARIDNTIDGVYGYSPALRALRTMKLLNKVYARYIDALDGAIRPSVMVDLAAYSDLVPEFFFEPGCVNVYDSKGGKFSPPQFYVPPSNLPGGMDFIDRTRQLLDRFFFRDLFTIIQQMNEQSGRQRTAREISELVNEKNSQILPLVARFLDEMVSPVLKKVFFLLYERGFFGEPPAGLEEYLVNGKLNLQYFSPLALAAKQTRIQGTLAAIEDIAPFVQARPDILDVINFDALVRDSLDVRGANPDHINSRQEIAKIREARQQAEQQAAMQEQAMKLAGSQNLNERPADGSAAAALINGGF